MFLLFEWLTRFLNEFSFRREQSVLRNSMGWNWVTLVEGLEQSVYSCCKILVKNLNELGNIFEIFAIFCLRFEILNGLRKDISCTYLKRKLHLRKAWTLLKWLSLEFTIFLTSSSWNIFLQIFEMFLNNALRWICLRRYDGIHAFHNIPYRHRRSLQQNLCYLERDFQWKQSSNQSKISISFCQYAPKTSSKLSNYANLYRKLLIILKLVPFI